MLYLYFRISEFKNVIGIANTSTLAITVASAKLMKYLLLLQTCDSYFELIGTIINCRNYLKKLNNSDQQNDIRISSVFSVHVTDAAENANIYSEISHIRRN